MQKLELGRLNFIFSSYDGIYVIDILRNISCLVHCAKVQLSEVKMNVLTEDLSKSTFTVCSDMFIFQYLRLHRYRIIEFSWKGPQKVV